MTLYVIIFRLSKSQYVLLFTVKTSVCILRNEMDNASLVLHGSRSSGLESHADEEPPMLQGYSPRVVLHRIPLTATDENISTPTSSPVRVSTTPSRTPADHQVHAVIYNCIMYIICDLGAQNQS